jgi:hypothetical protein
MRALFLCLLGGVALVLGGCASTEPEDPTNPRVSQLAWNRPEKGEGQNSMFSGLQQGN